MTGGLSIIPILFTAFFACRTASSICHMFPNKQIACHLSMIRPELVLFPSKYEVGDTQEEFSDAILRGLPSWCSRYADALEALLRSFTEIQNLQTFRRRGMRTHRRWRRDDDELFDYGYIR